MKKVLKSINASTETLDKKFCLLPSDVLNLLNAIKELEGKTIAIEESAVGDIQFVVGDYIYVFTLA